MRQEPVDCLVTRHDFGRDVLAKWALEVTLCGLERGPETTKETEVYPYTTFQFFMNTLKKTMEKVKNLGGWNPTLAQRDETVANYHVQYIIDNSFQPPSVSGVKRVQVRFQTCLTCTILSGRRNITRIINSAQGDTMRARVSGERGQ